MLSILLLIVSGHVVQPNAPTTRPPLTSLPISAQVSVGRRLAVENCQSCHAIGRLGRSSNALAPQFRYLSRRYPIDNLAEAFAEGVLVGHSVMPQFEFAPDKVTGLIAYLKSIQAPVRVKRLSRSSQ